MSGFKIPIFLGSILGLMLLVIQNRTPVIQLTFLGMRSRPFSLGLLVAVAGLAGLIIGLILQRGSNGSTASTSRPKSTSKRSTPNTMFNRRGFRSQSQTTATEAETSAAKGWDTAPSTTWDGQPQKSDESEGFWAAPKKQKNRDLFRTPRRSSRDREPKRRSLAHEDEANPVVEAEYRVVSTPYSRYEAEEEGFDDAFFDEFLEEDEGNS